MRELIARLICFLALAVVTILALLFAVRHNSTRSVPLTMTGTNSTSATDAFTSSARQPLPAIPATTNQSAESTSSTDRGREVFAQEKCMSCHSIQGSGNPRYPLDSAGVRWQPEELRGWITGTGIAADRLSSIVIRRKQRYRELSDPDMNALVFYLSTLKQPLETP